VAGKEGRVQFNFQASSWERWSIDISPDAWEQLENGHQCNASHGTHWAFDLRCGAGACAADKQVQRRRGSADTRAVGSLRRRCEYGKPEGNRAEGTATGLAPERRFERRRLSSDEYFRRVPAQ